MLAYRGIHVTSKCWASKTRKNIVEEAPAWVVERLKVLTRLIAPMEAEEKAMTEAIQEVDAEMHILRCVGPLTFEVCCAGQWATGHTLPTGDRCPATQGFARANTAVAVYGEVAASVRRAIDGPAASRRGHPPGCLASSLSRAPPWRWAPEAEQC